MIEQAWAEAFAQEWIEGWNSTTLTGFWRTKAAPSLLFLGRHTTQRVISLGQDLNPKRTEKQQRI